MNQEQEEAWAAELRESRKRFVARVKQAMYITSPTKRMELYQKWRAEIGDIGARETAKFTEAVRAGRVSLKKIEDMI